MEARCWRLAGTIAAAAGLCALAAAFPSGASAASCAPSQIDRAGTCTSRAQAERRVLAITDQLKEERNLRAVILRVDVGGRTLAETAIGRSMAGVPATTKMRFRIGSMAIPYLTTILLQLQDRGRLSLDDKLSQWFPNLPEADQITLRMLASSTSGYYDFAQGNPVFLSEFANNVFKQWTPAELLQLAFARGFACDPGTCFNYSHANFIILGKVITKVTGKPLATLMRKRIFKPLGLDQTEISAYPAIPPPVLHAYNERATGAPYEDSTYWSNSWALEPGALQTAPIDDVARSAPAIGAGSLISRRAYREMLAPPAFDAGQPTPPFYYGLGILVDNGWLVQNPSFNGYVGVMADLAPKRISISVESTVNGRNPETAQDSIAIFNAIAGYLTPDQIPTFPP